MNVEHVRGVARVLRAFHAGLVPGRGTAVAKRSSLKIPKQVRWIRKPEVLLLPPIPEPMHGMAPRVVLGVNWWNKTRLLAYKSTGYHCIACGVFKTEAKSRRWLEGHECYEIDFLLGRMVYVETVPLCHYCHNFCHPGRMRALLESNGMTHSKYAAIMQHGAAVLKAARLEKPLHGQVIETYTDLEDWRLVIDGIEYSRKDVLGRSPDADPNPGRVRETSIPAGPRGARRGRKA